MSPFPLELPSPADADAPLAPVRIDGSRTAALVRAHAANDDAPVADADALGEDPPIAEDARTRSSEPGGARPASNPWSGDAHRTAAHLRSRMIGEAFVAAIEAIARLARRVRDAYAAHARAASTRMKLDELDDRMLRDLGFDRSEVGSISAEIGGRAEATRVHALLASHGVWR